MNLDLSLLHNSLINKEIGGILAVVALKLDHLSELFILNNSPVAAKELRVTKNNTFLKALNSLA